MIYYKESKEEDPYIGLWRRKEWLYPFENINRKVFPLIITVEPTNVCQNKCLYCSRQLMSREFGFMKLEIIEKIAQEAGKHNAAIRHGGFGEPLLHPQIADIIEICKRYGVLTTIFTNCNRLTEELMRSFIKSGLDEIRFSSSGITAEEHNRIRRNSNYQRDFDEKLEMAYRIRKEMKSRKPFFTIFTNVLNYEDDNFKNSVEYYRDKYIKYADKIDIDLTMFSRVKELEHVKELYAQQTIIEKYKPCVTLFHKVIIHWNGDVFACDIPYNFEESHFLGNMLNDGFSIEDAYNSPKINELRSNLSFNLNHKQYKLCKDCFSGTNKWDNKDWWLSG